MAATLVTGGSGSGKTEFIYKEIIRQSMEWEDRQFFLIVPEQATMQAQREIVRLHPRHGTMNIDIVSFERLAYRIFSELSLPQPELLDDIGKIMVLRRLAGEKRDELPFFASNLNRPGFLSEMKSVLSELCQYGITPELLKETAAKTKLTAILTGKLSEISVLFRSFEAFISERYITTEELLDRLAAVCERSKLLRGSVLALDGYTGFTPIQYRLIERLLRMETDLYVTVTASAGTDLFGPGDESDLFDMSRKMAGKLRVLCADCGQSFSVYAIDQRPLPRFKGSPALAHLEGSLFRYPYRPYEGACPEISVVAAESPADEAEYTVNRIQSLVKTGGYRYREIAVICGDMAGYTRELTRRFEENGIPLFVDEKTDLMGNPLIRLIKSVLLIRKNGFDYESMFQYLRTGLVSEERIRIDRLETYVRALGIRGFARWNAEWETACPGSPQMNLTELNTFRREILEPLAAFREKTAGRGVTVRTTTEALVTLLQTIHAEEKMKDRSERFLAKGLRREAREYAECYGFVMDLFSRLVGLLGDEALPQREYADIVNAGLSELKVGMIPASADRVVAGDLKRTRLSGIRVLFFLGVSEGVVPADTSKGGLLTEQERETLKAGGLELAPTAREEGFMQRFYLYLMLTKPSDALILSYPALSAAGKTLRPSGLIGQLKKRFPGISSLSAAGGRDPEVSLQAAKRTVIDALAEPERAAEDETFRRLYRFLSTEGGRKEEMARLAEASAYSYRDTGIGRAAAEALYGLLLEGSVTRLEGYAGCAYAHFLQYGLGLRKRQEYELDLSDMGNLFHRTIDLFFTQVRESGMDFREIGEEKRRALVKSCVRQVAGEYRSTILQASARNDYLAGKVERIADRTLRALIYQIKKGDFEPEGFEVDIRTRIPLRDHAAMQLRGRIDRMDVFEDEDRIYVKIMDYKSGSTSFDLELLYHGLQLQLAVYMDAALTMEAKKHPGKQAVPAGLFYYHIDDPVMDRGTGQTPEDIEAEILRQLRMNGLVNSSLETIRHLDREIETESDVIPVAIKDGLINEKKSSVAGEKRFDELRTFVRERLKRMGLEILDGTISVNPYKRKNRTECDYCQFHSVCGFDPKTEGFGYRKLADMEPEEIWARIEEEGGHTDGSDELDGGAAERH